MGAQFSKKKTETLPTALGSVDTSTKSNAKQQLEATKQDFLDKAGTDPIDWGVLAQLLNMNMNNEKRSSEREEKAVKYRENLQANSVELRGISIDFVKSWWEDLVKVRPDLRGAKTRAIVSVIREQTKTTKRCLWESAPQAAKGLPQVAISHSWDYSFEFLVDVISKNRKMGPAELSKVTFVWLDLFALTQHTDGSTKQAEEIAKLGDIFGESCPFVAQVIPSSEYGFRKMRNSSSSTADIALDLGVFSRSWCVFEFCRAASSGARFTFLSPDDRNTDWMGPLGLIRKWDPSMAQSLFPSDKQNIDTLVLQTFVSWNTIKMYACMVFLKLNNSGPIFFKAAEANICQLFHPWEELFLGSEKVDWGTMIDVYADFYCNREVKQPKIIAPVLIQAP